MRAIMLSIRLALHDYWWEKLLSACAVLSLAAMLTPLLVLFGVRHGIISTLQEQLMSDPRTLELIPEGSSKYTQQWLENLKAQSGVNFLLPQTRTIAATMHLRYGDNLESKRVTASLIATANGDPLLSHWQADPTLWLTDPKDGSPFPVTISSTAARKLGIEQEGTFISGEIDRRTEGKVESRQIPLRVARILPLEVQQKDALYISLALLVALENYRDGFNPTLFAFDTTSEHTPNLLEYREYPTFRLYARSLDDVDPLRLYLMNNQIQSKTQIEEIERVKSLNYAFTSVFALICGASVFGFVASTISNALASVRRKSTSLGIIRLLGFPRTAMMLFPIIQALTTGILGFALATVLYLVVAYSIDSLFTANLPAGSAICSLLWQHFGITLAIISLLSVSAAFVAAWKVSTIEPSEVVRNA